MPINRKKPQTKQNLKSESDAIQLSDKLEGADKRRRIIRRKISAQEKRSFADAVETDVGSFMS